MIAAPGPLGNIVNRLRSIKPRTLTWWRSPWKLGWWWFSGVNLWDQKERSLFRRRAQRYPGEGIMAFGRPGVEMCTGMTLDSRF
jgi:hypothetical protein